MAALGKMDQLHASKFQPLSKIVSILIRSGEILTGFQGEIKT
jgi:hypothetical protein